MNQDRKLSIGGSDSASILGLSRWKTNIELWEEKTGISKQNITASKQALFDFGNACEPAIRTIFEQCYKIEYKVQTSNELLCHAEYPFLTANVDGLLTSSDGRKGVLEIKTKRLYRKMEEELPIEYHCQGLHYLNVTGSDFILFYMLIIGMYDQKFIMIKKERKDLEDDIAHLQEAEIKFWNEYVIPKKRPALILNTSF